MATKTFLGVRYKLGYTGKSKWGPGKRHLLFYRRGEYNRTGSWRLECRPGDSSGMLPYNLSDEPVDSSVPVEECAKCAPMIERVFGGGQ